ncbi:MAG TPA: polysaccharide export protein, partial [Edaphobacter sp.]
TLLQAATLAGGPNFEGQMNDLRLIRTYGNDRRGVKIDMKRVMNGKDPDPVLQTDDIVLLPTNILKAALKSGGLGTLVAFGSLTALVIQR